MGRGGRWLFLGLAAAALLLLVGRAAADAYVDYRWYAALGAAAVWWAKAENVALLKLGSIAAAGAFIFANLYAVRQSVAAVVLPRRVGDLEIGQEVSGRALLAAVGGVSLLLAALLSVPNEQWVGLAGARWGVSFGESDSRFQADLGFWVYWLPLERALYERALFVLAVVIAAVAFIYGLTQSVQWERGALRVSTHARRHLSVLSGCVLVVLGWSYRLDAFNALLSGSGAGGLPTWVDHKVNVPASLALAFAAVIAGAVVGFTGWAGQTRLAFGAATSVLALSLVLRQLAPNIAERMTLGGAAARAVREAPYTATRAAYTRRAFGADRVTTADSTVAYASAAAAAAGVPLWDGDVLATAVERTRRLGVASGNVAFSGPATAPVLSVVERPAAVPGSPDPLAGWEVVRASGTEVSLRGEPATPGGGSLLDEGAAAGVLPALVFDSAGGYLRLPDSVTRVAGVDVRPPGTRLALALSLQNLQLLRGEGRDERVVLHRDVRDRIDRIAPFFLQGDAITPAVADGTLYWLVHLYAASATYPVSRPLAAADGGWSYLRHAAVAVVDSYHGRVALVPDEQPDPIARTWINALPSLFSAWGSLPPELQRAVPPPVESGLAQAAAYAEYGARGGAEPTPRTVRFPDADAAGAARPPVVILPPNEGTPALSLPVVNGARQVVGLVLVLGGPLARTAWYAVDTGGTPIDAVLARLYRTPEVGSAPRDGRSERGPERVVPVAGGIGYVVPHYTVRGSGAPSVLGASTYFDGGARSGPTAVAAVSGGTVAGGAAAPPADSAAGLDRARALYDAARAALRAGDWVRFGRAYDELGAALRPPR